MQNPAAAPLHSDIALSSDTMHLYDPSWAPALNALTAQLQHKFDAIYRQFHSRLPSLPGIAHFLDALSATEQQQLRNGLHDKLIQLASPQLDAGTHHRDAAQSGNIHAKIGITTEDLMHSQNLLLACIRDHIDPVEHAQALSLLGRRLLLDVTWQMDSYQRLRSARHDVLLQMTHLAWNVSNYTDLIERAAGILGRHEEIAGCSFGRPDGQGVFRFEAAAGRNITAYFTDLEQSSSTRIMASGTQAQGPTGRAWNKAQIEHSINFATDPQATPWAATANRNGFRSKVAIPLCPPGGTPTAILSLYSTLPGGYTSAEHIAFITQLQTLLVFAITHIENQQGRSSTVPYAMRQHWAALLRSEALEMHYQPIVDLKSGRASKVEALARLRDGTRLLAPGQFFSALSSDDFFELYTQGLRQTLAQRKRWKDNGLELDVSVNLPPQALADMRYFHATQEALRDFPCAQHALTLEILETDEVPANIDLVAELMRYKALGVNWPRTISAPATAACRACASCPSTPSRSTAASRRKARTLPTCCASSTS